MKNLPSQHADGEDGLEELASDGAMSIDDGAEFIGTSRAYMYELLGARTIQSAKLGRRRVVFKRSLINYLAARAT